MENHHLPDRFYLLDVMRGFASLAVVLFHYKNFLKASGEKVDWEIIHPNLPFFDFLSFFYVDGQLAIYLFYVLSGFVFFMLYLKPIQDNKMSARRFTVLRFSRLYPLHFATLIFVAIGQETLVQTQGHPFNYINNDAKHFILNLLMITEWGLKDGYSFNGPFWSVSIEILLYTIFFWCAPFLESTLKVLVMVLFGIAFTLVIDPMIGHGIICFFMGGCSYFALSVLVRKNVSKYFSITILTIALVAQILLFKFSGVLGIPGLLTAMLLLIGILPCLILVLALLQMANSEMGKRFRIIGDITYATYLIHFPIQLLVVLILVSADISIDFFHWTTLAAYLAAVIALSIPTYYLFELPAQRFIRRRLLRT